MKWIVSRRWFSQWNQRFLLKCSCCLLVPPVLRLGGANLIIFNLISQIPKLAHAFMANLLNQTSAIINFQSWTHFFVSTSAWGPQSAAQLHKEHTHTHPHTQTGSLTPNLSLTSNKNQHKPTTETISQSSNNLLNDERIKPTQKHPANDWNLF